MRSDAAELHRELLEEVGRLRSSEEWLEAIVAATRFHDYSLGNWLLLWSQAERRGTTVSRPAGYRTWQRLGRQVRRGEKGYRILAPVTRRVPRESDDGDGSERGVVGFRVVTVFDPLSREGGLHFATVATTSCGGDSKQASSTCGQGLSGHLGSVPGLVPR